MNNMRPSILVIGDLILDHYLYGTADRISPEAPVPIVDCTNEKWFLGGAANVANNLISIGVEVSLAGVVGDDQNGRKLKDLILSKGIKDLTITSKNRRTTTKSRIISSNHQLLRLDYEDRYLISDKEESDLYEQLQFDEFIYNCIIISDYNKGLLTDTFIRNLIESARLKKFLVLVDPKTPPFLKFSGAYLIKPNRKEAFDESGIDITDEESFIAAAKILQERTSCKVVVITLSEGGVGFYENGIGKIIPTKAKEIFDVTGAGDTFIAVLAYSLVKGRSIVESCELSNYASSIVISKYGCVAIEYDDIKSMF